MKRHLKLFSCLAIAAAIFSTASVQAEVSTEKTVDVPLRDMRKASAEAVQKRVLKDAQDGIVLIYSGEPEDLDDVVRNIAGECAARGFQVKSVLLTNSEGGAGVTMHGQDGAPLGPMVALGTDMKSQAAGQIEQLRERLSKASSETAATDPQDVMHCRMESMTGSLVRKTKVCSTPRQDAARTKGGKDWTTNQQNKGGNEAMPGGG